MEFCKGNHTENQGYIVFQSPLHGDGVCATKNYTAWDIIYREKPLHFLQTIPNRLDVLVCSYCYKFIGSVGVQLRYLQKKLTRHDLTNTRTHDVPPYKVLSQHIIPCQKACGELYCSETCRDSHWSSRGHQLLCTGAISDSEAETSALYNFKLFSISSNEIFLMVADIVSEVSQACHNPLENEFKAKLLLEKYSSYVRNNWWEVATTKLKGTKKQSLANTLRSMVKDAYELLEDIFELKEKALTKQFDEDFISRLSLY